MTTYLKKDSKSAFDGLLSMIDGYVDTAIYKPTFGSSELMRALEKLDKQDGVESITLVGLVTNMCVISNAIIAKAACPEAEIIVKKDLVDSFNKELHQKALDVMESMQITIE